MADLHRINYLIEVIMFRMEIHIKPQITRWEQGGNSLPGTIYKQGNLII